MPAGSAMKPTDCRIRCAALDGSGLPPQEDYGVGSRAAMAPSVNGSDHVARPCHVARDVVNETQRRRIANSDAITEHTVAIDRARARLPGETDPSAAQPVGLEVRRC